MNFNTLPHGYYHCLDSFDVFIGMELEIVKVSLLYDCDLLELQVSVVLGSAQRIDRSTYFDDIYDEQEIDPCQFRSFSLSKQISLLLDCINRRYLSTVSPFSWVNDDIKEHLLELFREDIFVEV